MDLHRTLISRRLAVIAVVTIGCATASIAAEPIPHHQDQPPGPALSPEEAVAKMTVPEGFQVEVVASEPDIVNPVAMTIDERGRFWITESLEYPRREAGPGRDRIKVLEDTDGDGQADKFSIFADGLNIPSGIAVGYGGVWVANSPDILFLQDTDGDGKADKSEVVVTGFGRRDTHELPNSLTWGPDGWLYGLNGIFNNGHVHYSESNPNYQADHPGWPIDAAMFRIHPRTREFEIFARGVSNPWGIAFNEDGEAFVSACVIDHLWHITETGYYRRQAGAYPPFTWPIESIVDYKHQKAAYCGIHYFDSDAYPEDYRRRLYMGNIHGGCINVDRLEQNGSTYKGAAEPDFLTANDAWFMPVVQKTGPDGSLYILDWYDRYHCYQDANRDPAGIDRLKGRLYRVRYKDTPRKWGFDYSKASDEKLIELLGAGNDYTRWTATRLLQERGNVETRKRLREIALRGDVTFDGVHRLHAFYAQIGVPSLADDYPEEIRDSDHLADRPAFVSLLKWSIRETHSTAAERSLLNKSFLGGNADEDIRVGTYLARRINPDWARHLPTELSPIRLQQVIQTSRLEYFPGWFDVVLRDFVQVSADSLIPQIVWQNLHPHLEEYADDLIESLREGQYLKHPGVANLMPRIVERVVARRNPEMAPVAALFELLTQGDGANPQLAARCLDVIAERVQTRQLSGESLEQLKTLMSDSVRRAIESGVETPVGRSALLLAAAWRDEAGMTTARRLLAQSDAEDGLRLAALRALASINDEESLPIVATILARSSQSFRSELLSSLGAFQSGGVAAPVLAVYSKLEVETQPLAIELLTQRSEWAKSLLAAIGRKEISANSLNLNQVRRLLASNDPELKQLVEQYWGAVRTTRDPGREKLIQEMKQFLSQKPGNALAGEAVFNKVCANCHTIYGKGAQVGPDITRNGRSSYDQLLSNVFDPSLVIGAGYQARTVTTVSGRILTGLPVEENDQRVVLKVQGGKLETIPRSEIDELVVSELSMMPEQLEKQLKPEEISDLFEFLTLDRHPSDPRASRLSGVR